MADDLGGTGEALEGFPMSISMPSIDSDLGRAMQAFWEAQGYEPPPHDVRLFETEEVRSTFRPVDAEIDSLTRWRARSKTQRILENLDKVDASRIEFDPFFGETDPRKTLSNPDLGYIVGAELYVGKVARSAVLAREVVMAAGPEMVEADAGKQEKVSVLRSERWRAEDNLRHVREKLAEQEALDPAASGQDDEASAPLVQRYQMDEITALHQLQTIEALIAMEELDSTVVEFSSSIGVLADKINVSYVAGRLRHRRRRRVWRNVRYAAASLALPTTALLLDQVVAEIWAFAGSAVLAILAFGADRIMTSRTRQRWIRSQLSGLKTAVRESGEVVNQLKRRELQFNAIRAMHGLPSLALLSDDVLDPPR